MNNMIKSLMGMGGMTDQVIASDFLISAKAGVRNLAFAITECTTPEVKFSLREQLRTAVATHESISNYMVANGMYHPNNLQEQLQLDLSITETALNLTND
ncbi:spore coat protein [Bacillus sp. DNRA2]|uniref:spore coat protein n=1 Tax=Bacillus sp. DNRA2 TaxID=2723053 RepID=UPI00145D235C|nr:spore coat protein [Bacillus sp. DNRA2]NMD71117.1 spore coat protein [Bacillus sp. DNRA2]